MRGAGKVADELNLSQDYLNSKIYRYMKLMMRDQEACYTFHPSNVYTCNGYSYYLAHQYLNTHHNPGRTGTTDLYQAALDDLSTIARWKPPCYRRSDSLAHRQNLVPPSIRAAFERTIALVASLHDVSRYIGQAHQLNVRAAMQDTEGQQYHTTATHIYSFQTATALAKKLRRSPLKKGVYLLGYDDHAMVLIKNSSTNYVYYDCNNDKPIHCSSLGQVARAIANSASSLKTAQLIAFEYLTLASADATPAVKKPLTKAQKSFVSIRSRSRLISLLMLANQTHNDAWLDYLIDYSKKPGFELDSDTITMLCYDANQEKYSYAIDQLTQHPNCEINKYHNGYTLLLNACYNSAIQHIPRLLAQGADITARSTHDESAMKLLLNNLHTVNHHANIEGIVLLLLHGYHPSRRETKRLQHHSKDIQHWLKDVLQNTKDPSLCSIRASIINHTRLHTDTLLSQWVDTVQNTIPPPTAATTACRFSLFGASHTPAEPPATAALIDNRLAISAA